MSDSSEFICEVVRVLEVSKHPNADRLSIVKVGGKDGPYHYSLVTGDTYVPGDLAVLVGVDSLVPVGSPEWEYCKKRLDYKPGASHYRIRRAKIRFIATDGVLVSLKSLMTETNTDAKAAKYIPGVKNNYGDNWFALGNDVSQVLGVLKYETPEEQALRVEKIPNSEKVRIDAGNGKYKRLIPDYSVLNLRKVSGLFEENELVEVSEKIHGSNIRFGKVDGKLFVGSHHAIKSDMRNWWRRFVDRLFRRVRNTSGWYGEDIFTEVVQRQYPDWRSFPEGYIFYGEVYGPKVQKLTYGRSVRTLRVYDIWDVKKQEWLAYLDKIALCADNLVDMTPVKQYVFTLAGVQGEADLPSEYTTEHIREGVVVKSLDGKRRGKWVSDKYREVG